MIFLDSETCGLHGVMVLLQYAEDDGEIKLHDVWREPIGDTLELLEWVANQEVCMFNAAFDWFHISKIYSMFSMFPDSNAIPQNHIEELAVIEEKARLSPLCIKPKKALDLMLHSRKGPYQSLMDRNDIRIKKVPTRLSDALCAELEKHIELDGIYFAKRKDPYAPRWVIRDTHLPNGDINPDFKDVVLKFNASGALKVLAQHALNIEEDFILKFGDIAVDKAWNPKEFGYAPFALAVGKPEKWNWAWPEVIDRHINHWAHNKLARKYAGNDVDYTRKLYYHFEEPEVGDVDSELACMVGAVRWRGFRVDVDKLKKQRLVAIAAKSDTPTAPNGVKGYLEEVMDDMEAMILRDGTGQVILESIEKWKDSEGNKHKAAVRSSEVLQARKATKEIELFDKLIKAGRFHASFKVIGALSERMSGADGLNPQGIKATNEIRGCFPLAEKDFILSKGDFDAFEVVIAEAVYNDPKLRADLLAGKKIHALFAQELFDMTYEEVMSTKGSEDDKYTDGKRGVFGMTYGGDYRTLMTRIGIEEERAIKAYEGFGKRYPGIGAARERIKDKFCSMRQPGGIGTAVIWNEPAEYIESLLHFRRYFTLENKICKALFDLAQNPPKNWRKIRIKVNRRDRIQTAAGAVQSALYAAAFNIQSSSMRAAANHEIQSTGAGITKAVQKKIWDLQPCGVAPWRVQPMNVHDEILTPCTPEIVDVVDRVVNESVDSFKQIVPLIKMEWEKEAISWAKN